MKRRDRKTLLAALALSSISIPGVQSCSLPPPPESWLEDEAGDRGSIGAVRTDSVLSDEEMEQFLLNASVVTAIPATISSSTFPMVLEVRWKGEIRKALFKYKDSVAPDTAELGGGSLGEVSPDSYRYEVAAYRVDRLLGLNMVPVAVLRSIKSEGALIQWIPGAFTEKQLEEMGKLPTVPQALARQRASMELFDALIQNRSRKDSDRLVTPGDWRLHLIDHSRAFGTSPDLPASFRSRRASLPRSLLERLESLDDASLENALYGILSDTQIASILERRDEILAKIASDRRRYGDAAVLQD